MTEEIQRSLGRIEGKLDLMLETQEGHTKDIEGLKDFRSRSLGIVAFISGIVGACGSTIASWIKGA